jgi:hypothetical protein
MNAAPPSLSTCSTPQRDTSASEIRSQPVPVPLLSAAEGGAGV